MTLRRTGLLVSDVDSTFLTQEVIELVADHAGTRDEVAAITDRAMRGEIDFEASLRERVRTLAGLPASVLADVRTQLVPTPGALDLFERARSAGWVTALVSGGFHEVIDELAASVGVDLVRANRFAVHGGYLTGELEGPIIDRAAKATTLRELAEHYGIAQERTVAMGDGANDIDMVVAAGTGIAFQPKPALRDVADVVIDGPSLLDAWPALARVAALEPCDRLRRRSTASAIRGGRW